MVLEAADTAYEKDRQIKILKAALLKCNQVLSKSPAQEAFGLRTDNGNAIRLADKIEQEWRTEGK